MGLRPAFGAATAYFVALFTLGFVLGTIRVTIVAPRLGAFAATVAEVSVMLPLAFLACRWAVRRWRVTPSMASRSTMALWFLVLLLAFESLLGTVVFGRTVAEQQAALASPAGLLGLSAQVLAAMLPLFVARRAVP